MSFKENIKKARFWWYKNRPIITTRDKIDDECVKCMVTLDKLNQRFKFSTINPIIYDLEKLRANTWDQDKITKMQEWLKDYIGTSAETWVK